MSSLLKAGLCVVFLCEGRGCCSLADSGPEECARMTAPHDQLTSLLAELITGALPLNCKFAVSYFFNQLSETCTGTYTNMIFLHRYLTS